ncbi:MAG TPA: carboxypeptidase regulatory-like domain-containing protein [Terracidiphilus sp.]
MKRYFAVLLVGASCLLFQGTLLAQSDRGSIAGSVSDSTGAAVGGASVVARGTATGSTYKTVSTPEGVYRISDVAIGRYDITVDVAGFKTSVQQNVEVQINTVTALNVTLQLGDVKEIVNVESNAPTIQTESSDQGTVVGTKQIEELPLSLSSSSQSFLRSPETFVFLTPGTVGPGTVSAAGNNGVFLSKLAGGQNLGAEILLDGVSVQRQDTVSAFDQTAPSVEALDEFKVTTATPTAQFGRTSGGIESFTTKSGTNSYHGTVFDIFRNQALDANSWDNDYIGAKKPADHQNDFGGSLGGPVRIPHLYDGHDKTFFFFSWEQYRNKPGTIGLSTVPTQAERGGDFSALVGADTGIPNPCTPGQVVFKGQIFDPSTTNNVLHCRQPFAGNMIPSISTVAQNVLQYVPLPNTPGSQGGLVNNFIFDSADPKIETTTTFRIDESVTYKNKMFFSYSSREQNQLNNTPVFPGPVDGTYKNHYLTHYLRYSWDYLASPNLLNHFVVGLNRLSTASIGSSVNGTDWPAKLGIGNAFGQVFPTFQFNGSPQGVPYSGLSAGNDDLHYPNSLVFADSVSWTKGKHSLRFGGELRFFQFSVLAGGNTSPNYVFQNYQTAWQPNDATPVSGDPFASFLLGLPQSESLTVNSHFPRWNQRYYALYVQDDFKFRRNLTLNLGVRWDVDTPRHEATGAQSVLSLTANNPATPGQPGALIYGSGATGAKTYFKDIAPRIGFAWSPNFVHDTVVRGAYSIYYAPLSYSDFGAFLTSGTTANPNFSSGDNFTPVQSLDSGFPSYTLPSNAKDPTLQNFTTNSINTALPSYGRPGMVQNWDIEIQHQLAQDLILSVGYVGQHATRLNSGLAQLNTINPKYNALGAALQDLVDGTDGNGGPAILAQLGVTVPSWFVPGWGDASGNATIGNLLRPFPQFGQMSTNCCLENLGQSTYNALQVKLERRFRNGLNLLAAYTYSKTITDADGSYPFFSNLTSNVFGSQNPFNLRAEKAVSYQDVPHALVVSYLYEFPVGPGKRYLSHGAASKALGGWQVGGVQRYQTGAPVLVNEFATGLPGNAGGQYSGANYRYSLLPGQSLLVNQPAHWTPALDATWNSGCSGGPNPGTFISASNPVVNCTGLLDPSAASLAAGGGYVYGNLPQIFSSWRSPTYLNEDFSIIKRTTIRESQAIVFKLDIPNAFNRHVFGQVDGNVGDKHFGVAGFGNFAGIPTVINGTRQIQATLRYEF